MHRYGKSQNHYLPVSLIGNFIDLSWCGFSGDSPVDEVLFPESADAILKIDLLSFSAYIFVDGEIRFVFSLYDDSIRDFNSRLGFEIDIRNM